jgi:peptide/nickel transport system ATP-binding protein
MRWSAAMTVLESARVPELLSESEVLRVEDLTISYRVGDRLVTPIRRLDLSLQAGEIVGLIGDTGAGKSTLALALLGLVRPPGQIISGRLMFGGRDILAMTPREQRQVRGSEISIIVQSPRSALNPMLRIGRQISNVLRAHQPVDTADARLRAIDLLREVGINDPERRAEAYAHELSGGMAQRALIAMALASRPKLLVADEPTSGLDVTIQAQFLDQMWHTVQETGSATLLIARELSVIANYCDRVLVLHEGKIVEDQRVGSFFKHPEHPYSRAILALQGAKVSSLVAGARDNAGAAPLMSAVGLTKHFPVRNSAKVVQAVSDVTLDLTEGETLGLVGESGSGKTTVGRCLVRLTDPTDGRVIYRGRDLEGMKASELRRIRQKLQIVLQDPFESLNPRWTVAQLLEEPLRIHTNLNQAARRRRATDLLAMVELDPALLDRKPKGLGAGSMQRLNIARAFATDPEFIVLDEPTSVLSPRAIVSLVALLRRTQQELGVSYLFISHDLTTVRYLCHRVAVMYLGQIVEAGTVEQIFASPVHPYSRALLSAHLDPDPANRRIDRAINEQLQGEIPSPIDLPTGCYLASRCPFVLPPCRENAQALAHMPDGRQVRCWRVAADEILTGAEATNSTRPDAISARGLQTHYSGDRT